MSLLAAGLVALVGAAGLVRGALPQATPASASPAGAPMVVSGAYVREPANGVNAAAYFTVYNTTADADVLTTVNSGAGAETTLHAETDGSMSASAAGLTIPAHGSVTLSPGKGHAMIEKLYGALKPGQTVNLQLDFAKAGEMLVTAPVIAISAPAPTAGAPK
jgi:copper(I)-binding protein